MPSKLYYILVFRLLVHEPLQGNTTKPKILDILYLENYLYHVWSQHLGAGRKLIFDSIYYEIISSKLFSCSGFGRNCYCFVHLTQATTTHLITLDNRREHITKGRSQVNTMGVIQV
jgi:hypothetical protein